MLQAAGLGTISQSVYINAARPMRGYRHRIARLFIACRQPIHYKDYIDI